MLREELCCWGGDGCLGAYAPRFYAVTCSAGLERKAHPLDSQPATGFLKAQRLLVRLPHSTEVTGEGTLGKLITDEQRHNNVNNLPSEGVKLIYDFRQNPKKYLTIKFQLF